MATSTAIVVSRSAGMAASGTVKCCTTCRPAGGTTTPNIPSEGFSHTTAAAVQSNIARKASAIGGYGREAIMGSVPEVRTATC